MEARGKTVAGPRTALPTACPPSTEDDALYLFRSGARGRHIPKETVSPDGGTPDLEDGGQTALCGKRGPPGAGR